MRGALPATHRDDVHIVDPQRHRDIGGVTTTRRSAARRSST
jgi:hypothetical protein